MYYIYGNLAGKLEIYIVEVQKRLPNEPDESYVHARIIKRIVDKDEEKLDIGEVYRFSPVEIHKEINSKIKKKIFKWIF